MKECKHDWEILKTDWTQNIDTEVYPQSFHNDLGYRLELRVCLNCEKVEDKITEYRCKLVTQKQRQKERRAKAITIYEEITKRRFYPNKENK